MDLLCDDEFLMASPLSSWGQVFEDEEILSNPRNLGSPDSNFPPRNNEELESLLAKEATQMPLMNYGNSMMRYEVAIARLNAVNWMLNLQNVHGFSASTASLAVSYFDRYLSQDMSRLLPFKPWAIEMISVACISLAAKMEELVVPAISSLQIGGENVFEPRYVKRMEVVILKALDWRMCSITAFEYVHDLLQRLEIARHTKISIFSRVSELILGSLPEPDFLAFRPSVVALAAFTCALEETVPLQAQMYRKTLLHALPVNEVCLERCYRTLEDTVVDPVKPRLNQLFPNSPPSPMTVIETSSEAGKNIVWTCDRRGHEADPAVPIKKRKLELQELMHWDNKRVTLERDHHSEVNELNRGV